MSRQFRLVVIVAVALLVVSGCGSVAEKAVDTAVDKAGTGSSDGGGDRSSGSTTPTTAVGGSIPDGFPDDKIPLFEPGQSHVSHGIKSTVSGQTIWNVGLMSKKEVKVVGDAITEQFEKLVDSDKLFVAVTEADGQKSYMLQGEIEGCEFVIIVMGEASDGFETSISYAVSCKQ